MDKKYLPTGNEMISIPKLLKSTAGIEDITFLHMGCKGLLELRGSTEQALIEPFIQQDGEPVSLTDLEWDRLGFWVPRFSGLAGHIRVEGTVLAPIGERGFIYRMEVTNTDCAPLCYVWAMWMLGICLALHQ